MTEQTIRALADRFGLTVEKRITTGSECRHFATFEVSGLPERIRAAWPAFEAEDFPRKEGKGYAAAARVLPCNNPEHPSYGGPFIEVESIWCEVQS